MLLAKKIPGISKNHEKGERNQKKNVKLND